MLILILLSALLAALFSMTAATVYISETNGAGAVVTDNIANLNFGSIDSPNLVPADHPIIQGENSFGKYIRFKVHSLGTSTTIKDERFWKSAGTLLTGETMVYRAVGNSSDPTYTTPTEVGVSGSTLGTADPGAGGFQTVDPNGGTNVNATRTTTGYSSYIHLQLKTTVSTPVGAVNTKTLTFQYDES